MSINFKITSMLVSLTLASTSAVAFASDLYEGGKARYLLHDYNGAKSQFLKAVKANPKDWRVHYLLANCLVQLREQQEAKKEYSACLSYKPDAVIAEYCQKAILYLSTPNLNIPTKAQLAQASPVQLKIMRGIPVAHGFLCARFLRHSRQVLTR